MPVAQLAILGVVALAIAACNGARPGTTVQRPDGVKEVHGSWHLRRGVDARTYVYLSVINLSDSRIAGATLEVPDFQDFRPVDLEPGELRFFSLGVFAPRCTVPLHARLVEGPEGRRTTHPVLGLRADLSAVPPGIESWCGWPPARRVQR